MINIQEGAPYPADMDHLDQILSIGSGHALPEGAEVISVKPSTNFAARYPGGWGYVIAFTATDSAIRDYVTTYTDFRGENVEKYGGVKSEKGGRLARQIGGHRLHRYHRPLYYWFRRYGPSSGAPAGSGLAHYPRRTPLIAGDDRGLGAAVARKSGREGLAVVLIARNPARLEAPGKRFDANDFTMRY